MRAMQIGKDEWDALPEEARAIWRGVFRAGLTPALAAAAADGVVLTRVPKQMDWRHSEGAAQGFKVKGWNDALAAVLAGKVTV